MKHPVFCVLFPACHSRGAVPSSVLSRSLNFEFHLPSLMDSSDWACSSVGRVLSSVGGVFAFHAVGLGFDP